MHPLEGAPNFGIPAVIARRSPDQQAIALGSRSNASAASIYVR